MIRASTVWIVALAAGCLEDGKRRREEIPVRAGEPAACDEDNAGISTLPGFCAAEVADDLGKARHIAVTPSGEIYVALWEYDGSTTPTGLVALQDGDDPDAAADEVHTVFDGAGSGLAWKDGKLWFGMADRILRFDAPDGVLLAEGAPYEVVVSGLPADGDHTAKSVALDDQGHLYVDLGSATNSCQVENRVDASPGVDPCPELGVRAGIWRFDANGTDQTLQDGERYATGIRNAPALTIRPGTSDLVVVQQGRDTLHEGWPELYSPGEELNLPAEELFVVREGGDYGWPYCYFDPAIGKVLAPEYGGDGERAGRCAGKLPPAAAFGAHGSPLAIQFVDGEGLPTSLRGGSLISWHGSWHGLDVVGPLPGYQVSWNAWTTSGPSSDTVPFAWGFVDEDDRPLPEDAKHRPMGLAQGADGSVYVTDDVGGRIYRIWWTGEP